jgi:hypothetical protein
MYPRNSQSIFQKKVAILSGLFCLCVYFVPVSASAQTVVKDVQYQAALQELIDSLLEQIAVLQAQLDTQTSLEVGRPGIISGNVVVLNRYQISGKKSAVSIVNLSHRQYLKRVYDIFPSKYDAKLSQFVVFINTENEFDAFVETIPPSNEQWVYAVNSETLSDVYEDYTTELIVHELAHILSYDEVAGKPLSSVASCRSYFKKNGCPKNNSYILAFANAFWTEANLSQVEHFSQQVDPVEAAYEYYEDTNDQYVSGYAALSPEEDFAESFARYVTDRGVPKSTIASQKIWWFEQFPELVEIRKTID